MQGGGAFFETPPICISSALSPSTDKAIETQFFRIFGTQRQANLYSPRESSSIVVLCDLPVYPQKIKVDDFVNGPLYLHVVLLICELFRSSGNPREVRTGMVAPHFIIEPPLGELVERVVRIIISGKSAPMFRHKAHPFPLRYLVTVEDDTPSLSAI